MPVAASAATAVAPGFRTPLYVDDPPRNVVGDGQGRYHLAYLGGIAGRFASFIKGKEGV